MTTWFDLPQEVKQIVFRYVSKADSIVYVPKDRRRKVDDSYDKAHHFHDILLVSKQFITADEFAFAVLGTAKLTFDCSNDIRRLTTEVRPVFKHSVRRLHFRRDMHKLSRGRDSFEGFNKTEEVLSANFPDVRQCFNTMPSYCAKIGQDLQANQVLPTFPRYSSMVKHSLNYGTTESTPCPHLFAATPQNLVNVAASFLGNRCTSTRGYAWTRPQAWLGRLMRYAEQNNIEVVFQTTLCITGRWAEHGSTTRNVVTTDTIVDFEATAADANLHVGLRPSPCFSNDALNTWKTPHWALHLDAEFSTKDYVLRTKWEGKEYAFHQSLAYEMVQAPMGKSLGWWQALLRDLRYTGHIPRNAF